jgi:hypothetical protein
MALLNDDLSVWDIAFRWGGYDPDSLWFRLPLPVKDNFRLLMGAILEGEILCGTLTLAKLPPGSKADPSFYIRTYIDEVYHCIQGLRYDRKLLRWASLSRMGFLEWCEIRGIPAPEFWFPPGWKLEFEMSEFGTHALWATHVEPESDGTLSHISYESHPAFRREESSNEADDEEDVPSQPDADAQPSQPVPEGSEVLTEEISDEPPIQPSTNTETEQSLRNNQRIKIVCQQIASVIWKEDKTRSYPSVIKDQLIQKYGGAAPYEDDTVREWLKHVAPLEVKNRRGRPRKNGDKES